MQVRLLPVSRPRRVRFGAGYVIKVSRSARYSTSCVQKSGHVISEILTCRSRTSLMLSVSATQQTFGMRSGDGPTTLRNSFARARYGEVTSETPEARHCSHVASSWLARLAPASDVQRRKPTASRTTSGTTRYRSVQHIAQLRRIYAVTFLQPLPRAILLAKSSAAKSP
jgi:hypothetical protein